MDVLDRLHRKLVAAAARERPGEARPGFTVGEIYQQLVPYRAVREELGLMELAHYEHALLRLLAGERGYASLDLPVVVEELQHELASPNPILGIYRDYASVTVHVETDAAPVPDLPPLRAPEPPGPRPAGAGRPAPDRAPAASAPAEPGRVRPPACPGCGEPLPAERDVRFCPHCGAAQEPAACEGCGTRLNAEWNFCIRCGRRR